MSPRRLCPPRLRVRYNAVETGECPEWQRELTVNQPPHGFEGSSPSFPTTLRPCGLRVAQLTRRRGAARSRSKSGISPLVIPGRAKREPGIHTLYRGYGFRVQPCWLPRNDGVWCESTDSILKQRIQIQM